MTDLFERVQNAGTSTRIQVPYFGFSINFSNTGKRSDGWFVLTVDQLSQCLSDIKNNLDNFISVYNSDGEKYVEKSWRDTFSKYLTDKAANTICTTQTLPLFSLLAKIIHFSNSVEEYPERTIDLQLTSVNAAISELSLLSQSNYTQLNPRKGSASGISELSEPKQASIIVDAVTGANNYLYYGAPGTGKSYSINKRMREKDYLFIRTVFHSDMQNSDFVGALKPVQEDHDISYGFSPGPFARALVTAYKNPSRKVCLIIEELNRAQAASVFGELFLLLDRDGSGASEYDVDFPSDEFRNWFQEQTGLANLKLRLPCNLWLAATMNSADQGVFPIDTAFRRRWEQIYMRLNYAEGPEGLVRVINSEGAPSIVTWRHFVRHLNESLVEDCDQQEDRLVGPWFHKKFDEEKGIAIPGKVLIYIWDDILRHQGREILFDSTIKSYGELSRKLKSGQRIFSKSFLERLFSDEI